MRNGIKIIVVGLIICASIVLIAAKGCPRNKDNGTNTGSSVAMLSAIAVLPTQINLSWWKSSTNEDGFKIERSTNGISFTEITSVASNITTYLDTGLISNTTYYYRIIAYNISVDNMYTYNASATTCAITGPFLSVMIDDESLRPQIIIILSWIDNYADETGFEIERSVNGGNYQQFATVGANVISWSDSGLTPYIGYYYRVRANTISGDSLYSNEVGVVTTR